MQYNKFMAKLAGSEREISERVSEFHFKEIAEILL